MGLILIVEDDVDLRETVEEQVRNHGFDCVSCEHGARALEILEGLKTLPMLIFTNWDMPVMGGSQLLRHLRAHQIWKSIPVTVVSASNICDIPLDVDFVGKPVKWDQLSTILMTAAQSPSQAPPSSK